MEGVLLRGRGSKGGQGVAVPCPVPGKECFFGAPLSRSNSVRTTWIMVSVDSANAHFHHYHPLEHQSLVTEHHGIC